MTAGNKTVASRKRRSPGNAAPAPDPETYQVGTWHGKPNYGCPFCPHRTLDGTADVVTHIAERHRMQAIAEAQEAH